MTHTKDFESMDRSELTAELRKLRLDCADIEIEFNRARDAALKPLHHELERIRLALMKGDK